MTPERSQRRDDEDQPRRNQKPPKERREKTEREDRKGRKPRSQRTNDEEEQEGGRGDRNDRRRRQRTTSGTNEDEVDEQREEKVAMKDEKLENKRNTEAAADARSTKKWTEIRTKGVGRGKPLSKPKKTAADFAREAELERRKSDEIAAEEGTGEVAEEAPAVESGRFSNAASDGEGDAGEVFEKENPVVPEPVSSGRKRYSAQRQKPTMTTAVETPMQPVAIPETSARETQIIYVTSPGYPAGPMYYAQQPTLQTQEINPAMLRPIMLQNSHFGMAPPTNTPTGEFVPNMPAMPTGQYDPSQNFPDPNTGMVFPPHQFQMMPNLPFIPQQVYQPEVAPPAGYYQQNIPAPPRQGSPGQPIQTMPPVQPVLLPQAQPAQTSSGRKRTAAIPIKSPQNEAVEAGN